MVTSLSTNVCSNLKKHATQSAKRAVITETLSVSKQASVMTTVWQRVYTQPITLAIDAPPLTCVNSSSRYKQLSDGTCKAMLENLCSKTFYNGWSFWLQIISHANAALVYRDPNATSCLYRTTVVREECLIYVVTLGIRYLRCFCDLRWVRTPHFHWCESCSQVPIRQGPIYLPYSLR
jgi:hypothetical protein